MGKGFGISVVLHTAILILGYFGLPMLSRDVMMDVPIMVEVVDVSDVTNAPQPKSKSKPKQEPKKTESKPQPPEPEQKQYAKPTPAVPPPPPPKAPEPEVAVVAPQDKPAPKAKPKPKPKEKPEEKAKPKPKASAVLARAKPTHKPKPPEAFDSVLKTVASLKNQPQSKPKAKEKEKQKEKPKPSFEEEIARALITKMRSFDERKPLTISEIDLVRQQIAKCWNLPAGAKNAENMIIEIAVAMNPDGTVRNARVTNSGLQADPFLRAMAESALRAVLNRRCQPFKLPRDKFDRWKTMTLIFNPKEMFGS